MTSATRLTEAELRDRYGPTLLEHHAALLHDSAISKEVAAARRYASVETKARLKRLGFSSSQSQVPTLLMPVWRADGELGTYQHRPDQPRVVDGKPLKYETPARSRMVIDVPPAVRVSLRDPHIPLFITEGVRKADAAVSAGLCCIDLLGVWNWRGSNEEGGKTALADWEHIALNGRDVYLCFDSDVTRKREVYDALVRLKRFLEGRGATVHVIYLPGQPDGSKTGLDDFLAQGNGADDLLAHARDELLAPPPIEGESAGVPYRQTPHGLVWLKPTRDGDVPTPLTNFLARIVADVAEDDGAEVRRYFEVEAEIRGRLARFSVPASQFPAMTWAVEHLGASAIVYPGLGARDHARAAVQFLSGEMPESHVFAHLGWRQIGDQWAYLHAAGAIGPDGPLAGVEVRLADALARYVLPEPATGDDVAAAVRASLDVLNVAPDRVTVPGLAAVYRAAIGTADYSVHLAGPTGAGKSELAALLQQHYGAGMDARHLPGSWASTGNALEGLAFGAKDALLGVDDFAPTGATGDVQRLHREADRLFRAQGNSAGRQRMRADSSLRPAKPPRGLVLSTGEDIPKGQSLRARLLVLELGPDEIDWHRLTACQQAAAQGLYAQSLAAFVCWLAQDYEQHVGRLRARTLELRVLANSSAAHRRTPEIVASLAAGFEAFLEFTVQEAGLSQAERDVIWTRGWQALGEAAAEQGQLQAASEPAGRFLELLRAALANGRAHLANEAGAHPTEAASWGWRPRTVGIGDDTRTEWQPMGERVGWLDDDGENVYLAPDAAYAVAQSIGRDIGDALAITPQTLKKRLRERGLLASVEHRGGRDRLEVRKTLQGQRREVLHLHIGSLLAPEVAQFPQVAQQGARSTSNGHASGPLSWATNGVARQEVAQKSGPTEVDRQFSESPIGPVGPVGPLSRAVESLPENGADASPPAMGVHTAVARPGCCAGCGEPAGGLRGPIHAISGVPLHDDCCVLPAGVAR